MQPIHTFNVVPTLPEVLEPLREIAFNLWWSWQPDARRLFRHLDPDLWHRTNHSPLRMLQLCRQARLREVALDEDFKREMKGVWEGLRAYLSNPNTGGKARKAHFKVPPIELGRDEAVGFAVFRHVRVQEKQGDPSHLEAPDLRPDAFPQNADLDDQRLAFGIDGFKQGEVGKVLVELDAFLPAVLVDLLAEVAVPVEQRERHKGQIQIAGRLAVVA